MVTASPGASAARATFAPASSTATSSIFLSMTPPQLRLSVTHPYARQSSEGLSAVSERLTHLHAGPRQQALAGDVVDLQARPVRILEQDRVVAGGVAVLLRTVDHLRADLGEERMRLLDVLA